MSEISDVVVLNGTVLAITFTQIEMFLKILLLVVSIAYTIDKWIAAKKKKGE